MTHLVPIPENRWGEIVAWMHRLLIIWWPCCDLKFQCTLCLGALLPGAFRTAYLVGTTRVGCSHCCRPENLRLGTYYPPRGEFLVGMCLRSVKTDGRCSSLNYRCIVCPRTPAVAASLRGLYGVFEKTWMELNARIYPWGQMEILSGHIHAGRGFEQTG